MILPTKSGGGSGYEVILDNKSSSAPYGQLAGSTVTLNKGIYFFQYKLYPHYSSICNLNGLPSNANVNVLYGFTYGGISRKNSGWQMSNPLGQMYIFEVTADNTSVDLRCCVNGYSGTGTLYEYLAKCG